MALSETFPAEIPSRTTYAKRAAPARIPITARALVEWTYAIQRPDRGGEAVGGGHGISQTGLVVERLLLGCSIDTSVGSGGLWGYTQCDEDALTVHGVVETLQPRHRRLLMDHGRSRSVPNWETPINPMRCVPVEGSRGAPRGLYLGSGRKHVGSEITYEGDWPSRDMADEARIYGDWHKRLWSDQGNWPGAYRRKSDRLMTVEHDWAPEPYRRCADEVLQRARDEYRQWYEALWALCDGLEAAGTRGLRRYRIAALGAAYEPWNS